MPEFGGRTKNEADGDTVEEDLSGTDRLVDVVILTASKPDGLTWPAK